MLARLLPSYTLPTVRRQELFTEAEQILSLGSRRFAEDPQVHLSLAYLYLFYPHNKPLAYREMAIAEGLRPHIDHAFAVFQLRTRPAVAAALGLDGGGGSSSSSSGGGGEGGEQRSDQLDVGVFMEFKAQKQAAEEAHALAAQNLKLFWSEALRSKPDFAEARVFATTSRVNMAKVRFCTRARIRMPARMRKRACT
jgi:hypothetical protein